MRATGRASVKSSPAVIPGRREAADPESRAAIRSVALDSGLAPSARPGMTVPRDFHQMEDSAWRSAEHAKAIKNLSPFDAADAEAPTQRQIVLGFRTARRGGQGGIECKW